MNQQLKLHQITLIYWYFQLVLCRGSDNFDIFNLSTLGHEILIAVKTKTCPNHYFGCIHPTGKNDTLNESAAQTTTSDNIDLQILSIVFVWWLRQFWHFHPDGTCREILIAVKTKNWPNHYFGCIHPTGKNDALNESAAQTATSDSIDL